MFTQQELNNIGALLQRTPVQQGEFAILQCLLFKVKSMIDNPIQEVEFTIKYPEDNV